MIAKISGKVVEKGENRLILDIGGICYEVLVPASAMQRIDEHTDNNSAITLVTYHYYQVEPSKSIPVLIGFLSEVEKDFFQVFITVSGIGPKAALKALNQPISLIAKAIDEADMNFLKSLPGIGQQRARDIIAKLQHKVAKFGLLQDTRAGKQQEISRDMEDEALEILTQLEYKRQEAYEMIRKARQRCPDIQTTEELLNEVYKQRRVK